MRPAGAVKSFNTTPVMIPSEPSEPISNTIEVIKLTTLASAVAMPELLRVARDAQSLFYNPSPIVLAAIFYLLLLWPLVRLLSRFEHKKMGGGH
jgi:polar amino acid transport system permease protein